MWSQSSTLGVVPLVTSPLPPTGSTSQLIRISSHEGDAARESGALTRTSNCKDAEPRSPQEAGTTREGKQKRRSFKPRRGTNRKTTKTSSSRFFCIFILHPVNSWSPLASAETTGLQGNRRKTRGRLLRETDPPALT
ncbi:hypothetical protein PBY51_002392 [Eleginops maclovinus]|uniref:Uncharacterized protein n=1 Tax=Eleginops maclovinus TaxID=56733 RepID=A0AAN8AD21_ELEMC|nr:hypothetical protein PBY51_002392 [Eleginops maclovinus]